MIVVVFFYKLMPAGVHIPQGIIAGVAVPVQALGVARVGHDGVRLDEAPQRGIVAPGGWRSLGRELWSWECAGRNQE